MGMGLFNGIRNMEVPKKSCEPVGPTHEIIMVSIADQKHFSKSIYAPGTNGCMVNMGNGITLPLQENFVYDYPEYGTYTITITGNLESIQSLDCSGMMLLSFNCLYLPNVLGLSIGTNLSLSDVVIGLFPSLVALVMDNTGLTEANILSIVSCLPVPTGEADFYINKGDLTEAINNAVIAKGWLVNMM